MFNRKCTLDYNTKIGKAGCESHIKSLSIV